MALPQSNIKVIDDVDDGATDAAVTGDDSVEFSDLPEPVVEDRAVRAKPAKVAPAPVVEDDLPEQYRGKSASQIAKMHREAQELIGRQGAELGKARRLLDEKIRVDLEERAAKKAAAAPAAAAPAEDTEAEFFAKPHEAVDKRISGHPSIKKAEEAARRFDEAAAATGRQSSASKFKELHPDATEILKDQGFRDWIVADPVRRALLKRANDQFDVAAGNSLFRTWKELKAARTPTAEQVAATAAKKKQALKDVAVPSGGNAAPSDVAAGGKIYRRADIRKLMVNDPKRYEALADELAEAYRTGRVR